MKFLLIKDHNFKYQETNKKKLNLMAILREEIKFFLIKKVLHTVFMLFLNYF